MTRVLYRNECTECVQGVDSSQDGCASRGGDSLFCYDFRYEVQLHLLPYNIGHLYTSNTLSGGGTALFTQDDGGIRKFFTDVHHRKTKHSL